MPTYEYQCKKCKTKIEVEATVEEKSKGLKVKCPKCGSEETEQIFSSFCCISSDGRSGSGSGCCCCG